MGTTQSTIDEDGLADGTAQPSPSETINPLGLLVTQISGRGRGVFATRPIPGGTVLEEAPVLVLTQEQWEQGKMDDTILGEYGFCWSGGGMALGLGIASLFNHSSSPNVNYIRNTAAGTITFSTSRRVAAGDELCICYSADESKLWFVPTQGITRALSEDEGDGSAALAKLALNDSDDEEELRAREEAERKAAAKAERAKERQLKESQSPGESRREKGGNTHSARERRREKYRLKMEAVAKAEKGDAHKVEDDTPVDVSDKSLPTSTPTPTPLDPNGVLASAPIPRHRRPVVTADLPPALHAGSSSRHRSAGPVVLTDELEWEAVEGATLPESQWGLLQRARGPVEFEEDAEADNATTISVWAVEVSDPKLTRPVLDFVKDGIESDVRMRHLKRVRRIKDDQGEHTYIALTVDEDGGISGEALRTLLGDFNPGLSALSPISVPVPKHAAKTAEQLKARTLLWPVVFSPQAPRPRNAREFTPAKLAWVQAGIARILTQAAEAKAKGELPVGVYCIAPPESLWPTDPTFIPPTPGLRAASHDTRVSENHPLRHAAFNCIAQIARLRTVPPFSDIQSTRNGADYLLTSLSLFITHEPCVMCAMALVHSRVREVYFIHPRRSGGFEGSYGIHSTKDLNHRFDVWRWCGDLDLPDEVPPTVEI